MITGEHSPADQADIFPGKTASMIKLFAGISFFFILWGCTNNGQSGNEPVVNDHENHEGHQKQETQLSLNNGVRWKADAVTLANAAAVREMIEGAGKTAAPDYNQVADQLQKGLNKMITECKMRGREHDVLHQWLEPLLEKSGELKNATTAEEAGRKFREIEQWVGLFEKYFE